MCRLQIQCLDFRNSEVYYQRLAAELKLFVGFSQTEKNIQRNGSNEIFFFFFFLPGHVSVVRHHFIITLDFNDCIYPFSSWSSRYLMKHVTNITGTCEEQQSSSSSVTWPELCTGSQRQSQPQSKHFYSYIFGFLCDVVGYMVEERGSAMVSNSRKSPLGIRGVKHMARRQTLQVQDIVFVKLCFIKY